MHAVVAYYLHCWLIEKFSFLSLTSTSVYVLSCTAVHFKVMQLIS